MPRQVDDLGVAATGDQMLAFIDGADVDNSN